MRLDALKISRMKTGKSQYLLWLAFQQLKHGQQVIIQLEGIRNKVKP